MNKNLVSSISPYNPNSSYNSNLPYSSNIIYSNSKDGPSSGLNFYSQLPPKPSINSTIN